MVVLTKAHPNKFFGRQIVASTYVCMYDNNMHQGRFQYSWFPETAQQIF